MKRLLQALDALPRGSRWALVIVGLVASFMVSMMVDTVFAAVVGYRRSTPGILHIAVGAFIAASTRTLFPAVLSPRPWPVGIAMFVLDFLSRAGIPAYMAITYEYQRVRLAERLPLIGADVVAGLIGGMAGLLLIQRAGLLRERRTR